MHDGRVTLISVNPDTSDLLTLRAVRAIAEADIVVWAGSTLCQEVVKHVPQHADFMADEAGSTYTLSPFYDLASREGFRVAHIRFNSADSWNEFLEHLEHCGQLGVTTELVRS